MVEEIHVGEGELGGDVDPAQIVAELDAVEGADLAVEEHEVAEVQIAVAFADAAAGLAGGKGGLDARELGAGPRFEGVEARGLLRQAGAQRGEVVEGRGQHLGGFAEARPGPGDRCRIVECDDDPGELRELLRAELAAGADVVEALALGETAHPHRPFAGPVDGVEPQVEAGREAAVEAEFFLAEVPPQRGRAVIEEGQGEGLLELPGRVAGEEQPGDVGLDHLGAEAAAEGFEPVGERGGHGEIIRLPVAIGVMSTSSARCGRRWGPRS